MDSVNWIQSTDTQHAFLPDFSALLGTAEIGKLLKQTTFLRSPRGKVLDAKSVLPMRCFQWKSEGGNAGEGPSCCFWGSFWHLIRIWNAVFHPPRSGPVSSLQICGWWECQQLLDISYLILDVACTGIFLDLVVPVASWLSTFLVGTDGKASLVASSAVF